jgi:hypothetical protein
MIPDAQDGGELDSQSRGKMPAPAAANLADWAG